MELLTIGHGTLPAGRFIELLREAGVADLVDVRTAPGSRRVPHFHRHAMEIWVAEAGIAYRWEPRLGGWRRALPASPNTGLRNAAFRGYADHMESAEFRAALDELLSEAAAAATTVVMCSEALWWRCHRRLLADAAVLLGGASVIHLMHDGARAPHVLTPEASVSGGRLGYPAAAALPLGGSPG